MDELLIQKKKLNRFNARYGNENWFHTTSGEINSSFHQSS